MEAEAGNTDSSSSSSSSSSLFYEAPLGYGIEYVRPNGGLKKFKSAEYSNVSFFYNIPYLMTTFYLIITCSFLLDFAFFYYLAVCSETILRLSHQCYITPR